MIEAATRIVAWAVLIALVLLFFGGIARGGGGGDFDTKDPGC